MGEAQASEQVIRKMGITKIVYEYNQVPSLTDEEEQALRDVSVVDRRSTIDGHRRLRGVPIRDGALGRAELS